MENHRTRGFENIQIHPIAHLMVLLLHPQLLNLLSDGHLEPGCVCVNSAIPSGLRGCSKAPAPGPFRSFAKKKNLGFRDRDTGGLRPAWSCHQRDGWFQSTQSPRNLLLHLQVQRRNKKALKRQNNKCREWQQSRYHQPAMNSDMGVGQN